MNGDKEWNRWRGHTEALMENMDKTLRELQEEVKGIRTELKTFKENYISFYAKVMLVGGATAIIVSIIATAIIQMVIK